MRSKTYEVNEVLQTLFISYISPAAKYNPPPQCAHWGTSFLKEAFPCGGTGGYWFTVAFRYPSTPEAVDSPRASSVMRRKSFSCQRWI